MPLTVFSTSLNEFGRAYLFTNPAVMPTEDPFKAVEREKAAIFEQLMLFDRISFKVYGENVLVPLLIGIFGLDGFEALLEQKAIGFTLWTPLVVHLVENTPGVNPLGFGKQAQPIHSDPEKSIEAGLKLMNRPLDRKNRRSLTRKLLKNYQIPSDNLARDAVGFTMSGYSSGKLASAGIELSRSPIDQLTIDEKKALTKHASRLLEYRFLLENGMTSYANYDFFSLFRDTAKKVALAQTISSDFSQLLSIEQLPDLGALQSQLSNPFAELPRLRAKQNAIKFREWIAEASMGSEASIQKKYLDALELGLGFFKSKAGRCIKTLASSSISLGLGTVAGAAAGPAIGIAAAAVAGIAWDQVDEFLLAGVTRGWTPRMFLDDVEALSATNRV